MPENNDEDATVGSIEALSQPPLDHASQASEDRFVPEMVGATPVQSKAIEWLVRPLRMVLINSYRFTQTCLQDALGGLRPEGSLSTYGTVKEFACSPAAVLDIIIYYLHGSDASDAAIAQEITPIRAAAPAVPLIVFSDVDVARQARFMRAAMRAGAQGFVLMRSSDLSTTMAAVQFVSAGGTYVPSDLLLNAPPPGQAVNGRQRLTSRQADVLTHLKQGKANKIIAYDLGMSESTVKVHVRSIMRKLGAANRTEVVYRDLMRDPA